MGHVIQRNPCVSTPFRKKPMWMVKMADRETSPIPPLATAMSVNVICSVPQWRRSSQWRSLLLLLQLNLSQGRYLTVLSWATMTEEGKVIEDEDHSAE